VFALLPLEKKKKAGGSRTFPYTHLSSSRTLGEKEAREHALLVGPFRLISSRTGGKGEGAPEKRKRRRPRCLRASSGEKGGKRHRQPPMLCPGKAGRKSEIIPLGLRVRSLTIYLLALKERSGLREKLSFGACRGGNRPSPLPSKIA